MTMFRTGSASCSRVICSILVTSFCLPGIVPAAPTPMPFTSDRDTVFLAHYDGKTSAAGLRADTSAGARAPSERGGDCGVAEGGRFGNALRLSHESYVEYELSNVDLSSYTIEAWFRMDSEGCAWRTADLDFGKYRILHLRAPKKPYDSVIVEVYYHTWKVTHTSEGKPISERHYPLAFGYGRWMPGSEHHFAVTFDAGTGAQPSVITAYVDGRQIWQAQGGIPLRARNYKLLLGRKPLAESGYRKAKALAGLYDELRISSIVRKPADLSRPQWRGFLPGPHDRCRPELPLELYFSKPLDPAAGAPVRLRDLTAGTDVAFTGEHLGNGSVYQMTCASPLPFGHEFGLVFETGAKQARDPGGNRLDTAAIAPQRFRTRQKGEAPRLLPLKFRNDNTHVTVEGMERMCEYMDAIEFSMARVKDGWVSNHLVDWRVSPAIGGDEEAFKNMPKPAPETTYAELAAIDYHDMDDGKIDPLPRCKDLYEVVRKWDRVVHLQTKFSKQMPADEQKVLLDAWLKNVDFDWSRFHSWHKAKDGVLPKASNSTYALAYPDRGKRDAQFYYPRNRGWPGFFNPEWVKQAEAHGRTTWGRQMSEAPGIQRQARLGMDYMMNNNLAYKGDQTAREALHELHNYEDAPAPAVQSVTGGGKPLTNARLGANPVIVIRFNTQIEARTVNYGSAYLRKAGTGSGKIPLRIDADEQWQVFTVSPQQRLAPGTYELVIGNGKAPVSVAGLAMETQRRMSFRVGG